ncbi:MULTISPECIES: hypothetical protein [unclassified Streptomyces]|uniref:hypothetical protein n=1 Tax=unclassified Streptomyces TaxID=2593676 RepID=UPI0033B0751F
MSQTEKRPEDAAVAARRARHGVLPKPVRPADTVEEGTAATADPAKDALNPDEWPVRTCR